MEYLPILFGLIAVLASIYALTGQFNLLTDLTVFTIWIFYVLTFIGVIKLRKDRPELQRPYKVPLYPIIPAIAIIGGLFVIINQLLTATFNCFRRYNNNINRYTSIFNYK